MFKKVTIFIALCIIVAVICTALAGCNQQLIDVTYQYDYAWIALPNGTCVEGKVQSWTDYEDGDQIQVKIDGVMYLTDTTRCVLACH